MAREIIQERLQRYELFQSAYTWEFTQKLPRAAVLVALQWQDGNLWVTLTLRSSKLHSHPGEVSLPGGKYERGDKSPIETALREAQEEIGLETCTVLTQLTPLVSRMGILVFPVVAMVDEFFIPEANKDEVQLVFKVPLEFFLDAKGHSTAMIPWEGGFLQVHQFIYGGQHIWALTANILVQVAMIAFERGPQFEFDYSIYTRPPVIKSKL